MNKALHLSRVWIWCLLSFVLTTGPTLYAADSKAQAAKTSPEQAPVTAKKGKAKRDWYPFGGIVAATDMQAKTVSLKKKTGARVLKVDATSELEVGGKPATLAAVKIGDYAHGKLRKDGAGKEVILAAKFDQEKPNKSKEAPAPEAQKTPGAKPKK
ncbi:MAG TPA: hypothetical protein VJA21_12905 [Verrucomicrobiae bacterium]